jgi:hypothetical protein
MNKGDVIQCLDRPEIVSRDPFRMRSRAWMCSTCQLAVTSPEPISVPPQCRLCGGVAFEKVQVLAASAASYYDVGRGRFPEPL